MKILFTDVETTGLKPGFHEIVQMSGIIEIDGVKVKAFDVKMRPKYPERTSKEALEKQNVTIEELSAYPSREEGWVKIMSYLDSNVDRFDKEDKYYMCGYNINFDRRFIEELFAENQNKFFGAYFYYELIDVLTMAMLMKICGKLDSPNLKLTSVCEALGMPFKEGTAHNAIYDIAMTMKLFYKLQEKFTITS